MRITLLTAVFVATFLSSSASLLTAGSEKSITQTFEPKKNIDLVLNMGDCEIKPSLDGKLHVDLSYSYECYFEPVLKETTNDLKIKEIFKNEKRNSGFSHWVLSIPTGTKIHFKSATGGIHLDGTTINISGRTGTGSIEIRNANGDIDLTTGTGAVSVIDSTGKIAVSTGTGKVLLQNSKGNLKAGSGTGDISAEDITPEGNCSFSSGNGKVRISGLSVDSGTLSMTVEKTATK